MAKKSSAEEISNAAILKAYAEKKGKVLIAKTKTAQKEANISNSAKQKDLLMQIAKDLGYVE